jgi:uncharacterized protein
MSEEIAARNTGAFGSLRWRVAAAVLVAALVAGVALALARGPAAAATPGCGGAVPKLTVQGNGLASGTPNTVQLDTDIQTNASSATGALSEDDATTGAVIAALEGHGVAKKDISTTDVTLSPNYTEIHGQSAISGYGADNTLSVVFRHVGTVGPALDAATAAGGDALSVDSLQFQMADERQLADKARANAVTQAVMHAGAMAAAAGQRLGPVCQLTDDSSTGPIEQPLQFAAAKAAAPVALSPGSEQASAQITLVYALEPRSEG